MKRFHVNVGVEDLDRSIRFYTTLFGAKPTVREADDAKRMLDDPRISFAISSRGASRGVDHVGIQVDAPDELETITARLDQAGDEVLEQESIGPWAASLRESAPQPSPPTASPSASPPVARRRAAWGSRAGAWGAPT